MSAIVSVRIGAIAAGMSVMLLGVALAEQASQSGSQVKPSQFRGNEERSATQSSRGETATQSQSTSQAGRQHTANFRGTAGTATGQSQEVDQFLAQCMIASNQSEVELSQLAQQQAQHPQVKQFAQQMVQDHQQMIQQLQQIAGTQGSSTRGSSSSTSLDSSSTRGSSSSNSAQGQSDTSSSDSERNATTSPSRNSSSTPSSSSSQSSSASEQAAPSASSPSSSQRTSSESALSQSTPSASTAGGDTAGLLSSTTGAMNSGSIQQLAQIDRQINLRMSQMVKDELQQKSGAQFDKGYIGCAIGAHTHMLAALEVIGQQTQGQLAQVAQQAQPKVQQHLEQAKQIMKQLEGESGSTTGSQNQAERPTSRTQR